MSQRLATRILQDAAGAIEARGRDRDTPAGERSMDRAVAAFNSLVGGDRRLTELEGWLFMCCLKIARATAGKHNEDDYVDLAGYAGLAGECARKEEEKSPAEPAPIVYAPRCATAEKKLRLTETIVDAVRLIDSTMHENGYGELYESQVDALEGDSLQAYALLTDLNDRVLAGVGIPDKAWELVSRHHGWTGTRRP